MYRFLLLLIISISSLAEDMGEGDFQFKADKNWGVLNPGKYPVKNCNGITIDSDGRVIVLTDHEKNNVLIYDQSGALISTWTLNLPSAHGLTLAVKEDRDYLYITDTNKNKVIRTTIDGKIDLELTYPKESGKYKSAKQYRPATVIPAPNGDFYVLDGYGINYIIQYNWKGEYIRIFGGDIGEGDAQLKKWGPHGGCLDNRDPKNPTLLIACSDQQKIKRFSLDGKYIDQYSMPGGNPRGAAVFGEYLIIPNMSSNWPKQRNAPGYISVLDKNFKVIANIGGSSPIYTDGKLSKMTHNQNFFKFPHAVTVDKQGNLYVAQWNSGQTYPIKLIKK